MVLGISLRKSKKTTQDRQAPIRTPSLPDIRAQSMAWPESLVDLPSYHRPAPDHPLPPRTSTSSAAPIASIYSQNHPPTSFNRAPAAGGSARRQSLGRRPRMPTPFNIMVAGPRGVGKSALLRLLLQMSEAPASLDALPARPTRVLSTTTTELPGVDRLVLTVIDTPGLDYSPGAELELEKSVTALVKYVDTQYAETLGEESKVVRQSKGDHHVHLCIYLIDPSSIQSPAQRDQLRPRPGALRSETPEASQEDWDSDSSDEEDGAGDESRALTMLPAEVRAIQRLSHRTNVLPVVAHGDTLTDSRLARVKRAVRRDLDRAGVDLRLFGIGEEEQPQRGRVESRVERKDEDAPKVIKTRFRRPSRPRPGTEHNTEAPSSPVEGVHVVPKVDETTLANMFPFVVIAPDAPKAKSKKDRKPTQDGLQVQGEANVASRSPSLPGTPMAITTDDPDLTNAELTGEAPNAPSRSPSTYASPGVLPPSSWRAANQNGAGATGAGGSSLRTLPRGQFTRKYRWGTIDVLDPAHCDVGVLRGVVMGSHLKALKTNTREVLYERFRTEKLLARRATQNITPEQRSRLLKGLDP